MKSLKVKLSFIAVLALAALLSLAVLFNVNIARADRAVTVNGVSNTNILSVSDSSTAKIRAHKEEALNEYYTLLVLSSDTASINFRKNLAYHWFYNSQIAGNDAPATLTGAEGFFSMEIGFENLDFDKYVIAFESQEYNQTKAGKSKNYIIFTPAEGGKVEIRFTHKLAEDKEDTDAYAHAGESLGTLDKDHIIIRFTGKLADNSGYTVKLSNNGGTTEVNGEFVNVGGNFSKYSSSTTAPVVPISFKALFGDRQKADARMAIYSLNDQLFRVGTFSETTLNAEQQQNLTAYYLKADNGRYNKVPAGEAYKPDTKYYSYNAGVTENNPTDGGEKYYTLGSSSTINDDTAPVLCLGNNLSFIKEGEEITFDYTCIDVLVTSPTVTSYYYLLTDAQAEQLKAGTFKPADLTVKNLYREVSDSDNQYMTLHLDHYAPQSGDYASKNSAFGADLTAKGAVKVYLKLTDMTSTGRTAYILLDWYVKEEYLLKVGNASENNFIAIANDELGVAYGYTDTATKTSNPEAEAWQAAVDAYQAKIDAAAKEQNLKAGSKNYFYLPSAEELFVENASDYTDFSFNIYYKTDSDSGSSGQTASSKKSNTLSINTTKVGDYVFTIYATDKAGNSMYYYKTDKDGEPEKVEFTGEDIWKMREADEKGDYKGLEKHLPWFTFTVAISQIEIEEPGEQKTAYVGTEYKSISFDINGVSYDKKYSLYIFNNELYFKAEGKALTYDEFMEQKEELFKNHKAEYFTRIYSINEMEKTDPEYEVYGDYQWNDESLSFVPQVSNAFYLVECVASSNENSKLSATAYMGISAAAKVKEIKGEDTWLQDNMTSIILLCIAGASLIGIILLLVIKPKEQGDIDTVLEEKQSKKSKKNK